MMRIQGHEYGYVPIETLTGWYNGQDHGVPHGAGVVFTTNQLKRKGYKQQDPHRTHGEGSCVFCPFRYGEGRDPTNLT
jgi:hypothetical protein